MRARHFADATAICGQRGHCIAQYLGVVVVADRGTLVAGVEAIEACVDTRHALLELLEPLVDLFVDLQILCRRVAGDETGHCGGEIVNLLANAVPIVVGRLAVADDLAAKLIESAAYVRVAGTIIDLEAFMVLSAQLLERLFHLIELCASHDLRLGNMRDHVDLLLDGLRASQRFLPSHCDGIGFVAVPTRPASREGRGGGVRKRLRSDDRADGDLCCNQGRIPRPPHVLAGAFRGTDPRGRPRPTSVSKTCGSLRVFCVGSSVAFSAAFSAAFYGLADSDAAPLARPRCSRKS